MRLMSGRLCARVLLLDAIGSVGSGLQSGDTNVRSLPMQGDSRPLSAPEVNAMCSRGQKFVSTVCDPVAAGAAGRVYQKSRRVHMRGADSATVSHMPKLLALLAVAVLGHATAAHAVISPPPRSRSERRRGRLGGVAMARTGPAASPTPSWEETAKARMWVQYVTRSLAGTSAGRCRPGLRLLVARDRERRRRAARRHVGPGVGFGTDRLFSASLTPARASSRRRFRST